MTTNLLVGIMEQNQIETVVSLCKKIKENGCDPVLKLRQILDKTKQGGLRSCLNCSRQNRCFSKDAVTHMLNETALLFEPPINSAPIGSEIYSWNAENCIEFDKIEDCLIG